MCTYSWETLPWEHVPASWNHCWWYMHNCPIGWLIPLVVQRHLAARHMNYSPVVNVLINVGWLVGQPSSLFCEVEGGYYALLWIQKLKFIQTVHAPISSIRDQMDVSGAMSCLRQRSPLKMVGADGSYLPVGWCREGLFPPLAFLSPVEQEP